MGSSVPGHEHEEKRMYVIDWWKCALASLVHLRGRVGLEISETVRIGCS